LLYLDCIPTHCIAADCKKYELLELKAATVSGQSLQGAKPSSSLDLTIAFQTTSRYFKIITAQ